MEYHAQYHTGADISVFIGPLWVEEAVSLYLRTTTNDIVVYPYSDPHYSRSLIGRYMMQGSLTVNVTEPDYLLRLIEAAKRESITASVLAEMVAKRTSLFQQTLAARLRALLAEKGTIVLGGQETTEESLMRYVVDYTERVTREVELMSVRYLDGGKRIIDPRTFELTIISGRPGSQHESIEIFQDVKVVGTERISENNDQTQTVVYSIIARRKPPLVVPTPTTIPVKKASFVTENILEITEKMAEALLSEVIASPQIRCFATTVRTSRMLDNPDIGYIGDLSARTRFYGSTATYVELVWQLSLPDTFAVTPELPKVSLVVNNAEVTTNAVFKPPRFDGMPPAFSNAYGRLVSVNKEDTLDGLAAAAAVAITPLQKRTGYGSLYAPRKKLTGFGVGSLIPPDVLDPMTFGYTEDITDDVTASTLWSNPFNIRACGDDVQKRYREQGALLNEVVQPAYTFGMLSRCELTKDGIVLGLPIPVDYYGLTERDNEDMLVAEAPIAEGKSAPTITITDEGVKGEDVDTTDVGYAYTITTIDIDDIPTREELAGADGPSFGLVTLDLAMGKRVDGFGRYTAVRPFVLYGYLSPEEVAARITCYVDSHECDIVPLGETPSTINEFCEVAAASTTKCGVTLDYDFCIRENSESWFCLDGAFFALREWPFPTEVRCPVCGETLTYQELGVPTQIHILWLLVSLPVAPITATVPAVVHDTAMKRSRIAEFYNIVRCDGRAYDLAYTKSAGYMFIKEVAGSIMGILDNIIALFGDIGTIDREITGFVYPIKTGMGRIAQQYRYYSIDINVAECVDQLAQCTVESTLINAEGKIDGIPDALSITLKDALLHSVNRAGRPFVGGEDGARALLAECVRTTLTRLLEQGSFDVVTENDKTKTLTVRRYTISTLPSLVCYGLTDEGYKLLLKTSTESPELSLPRYDEVVGE